MAEAIIRMKGGVIRQQRNTILKNVNIEIQEGEFVYLIGKVGSGKSSFLKTLYAELPLEFGSAEVAGIQLRKIRKSHIPQLRRKCGIVFQDFKLLIDRNVYANLEFVLRATGWRNKQAIRERIETVLEKMGMSEKQEQMPHQLSGGEQQRIVLARALLNAPPIILADEPTGNIDPESSYKLVQLLKEICDSGKTVIIATHQYDLIERFPGRVIVCEDGEMHEQMPSDALACEEEPAVFPDVEEILPEEEDFPQEAEATTAEEMIVPVSAPTEEVEEAAPIATEVPAAEAPASVEMPAEEAAPAIPEPAAEAPVIEEAAPLPVEELPEEEDFSALIGELDYPEITAFDYEIAEGIPAATPYVLTEEEEPEKAAEEPVAEPEPAVEPENKKNYPPAMDLELID